MFEQAQAVVDLTAPIDEEMVVYPGDPAFASEDVASLERGDAFHLCHLHLGNHMGTHIDYPAHVIQNGKTSSDYPLGSLMGEGVVIEVPLEQPSVTEAFVEQQSIFKNDIVFFKTKNSSLSKSAPLVDDYVYVEPAAAKALVNKGAKIVGVDYISIDKHGDEQLSAHHALLANDVLIVEGLALAKAPVGRCKIVIAPLHLANKDGAPARVFCMV